MKAGWQSEKLGDVCALLNRGISPKYLEQGGICVLNQKCIRDHRINYEQSRRHDSITKSVSAERFIQLGDVLVNSTGTGTLGRVAQIRELPTEPTTVDSHVTIVRPKPGKFFQDFFGYMLIFIEEAIKEAGEGCGGQTELARSVLAERFTVCYPTSIDDQKRVVAILDEAFDGIATAKANAEKNLQNARALFESHLSVVEGEHVSLGDFVNITTGKLDVNAAVEGGEYPFFTCAREIYAIDKFAFDCEAILLAGNNAVGDFNVKHYKGRFNAYQRTYVITVKDEFKLHYRYLYFQLLKSLKKFKSQSVGAATKFLKLGMIKELEIPLPALAEQERIVTTTDSLLAETQRLESIYQQKLAALDELKKSLLHQAFSGQL
ncbi:MAG: restriction endonuclease subunit S [Methylococcaceae bacterium]|nr:restriction endonuclease subunit S [Methylococcaceae bacterium]